MVCQKELRGTYGESPLYIRPMATQPNQLKAKTKQEEKNIIKMHTTLLGPRTR
jgi:hypothetical protein